MNTSRFLSRVSECFHQCKTKWDVSEFGIWRISNSTICAYLMQWNEMKIKYSWLSWIGNIFTLWIHLTSVWHLSDILILQGRHKMSDGSVRFSDTLMVWRSGLTFFWRSFTINNLETRSLIACCGQCEKMTSFPAAARISSIIQ